MVLFMDSTTDGTTPYALTGHGVTETEAGEVAIYTQNLVQMGAGAGERPWPIMMIKSAYRYTRKKIQ